MSDLSDTIRSVFNKHATRYELTDFISASSHKDVAAYAFTTGSALSLWLSGGDKYPPSAVSFIIAASLLGRLVDQAGRSLLPSRDEELAAFCSEDQKWQRESADLSHRAMSVLGRSIASGWVSCLLAGILPVQLPSALLLGLTIAHDGSVRRWEAKKDAQTVRNANLSKFTLLDP